MSDKIESAEEFLAHYGVKGQKWGVRKNGAPIGARRMARMNKYADAGDKIRAKSGGSTGKSYAKIGARYAGLVVASNVGAAVIGAAAKNNPSVRLGANLAANVLVNAGSIKLGVDAGRVAASRRREKTS